MGSRKKKAPSTSVPQIKTWYAGLTIDQKIAFKAFMYWYGRQRITLHEFFTLAQTRRLGPGMLNYYLECGFTWLFGEPRKPGRKKVWIT